MRTVAMRTLIAGLALVTLGTGCSKIAGLLGGTKEAADAAAVATNDAATGAPSDTAAASPDKKPVNEAAVKRFPNEKTLGGETAMVSTRAANALESHPTGDIIAVLQQNTPVKRLAEHEGYVLVSFNNPADANERMIGWVTKAAVMPAGTVVAVRTDGGVKVDGGVKADAGVVALTCPAGEARFFGESDFCAQRCGTPSDKACAAGSVCLGSAPLSENGVASKTLARFCIHMSGTIPGTAAGDAAAPPPVVTTTDAGALTINKPLMMKAVGTICLPGYAYANDKFCRLACKADADCPSASFCVDRYGPKVCSSTK